MNSHNGIIDTHNTVISIHNGIISIEFSVIIIHNGIIAIAIPENKYFNAFRCNNITIYLIV
jgi:hypothetical protein